MMRRTVLALIGLAVALGAGAPGDARSRAKAGGATRFFARNVVMFPYPDAPATVVRLSGVAVPTRPGRMIDMDDVGSYAIRVRSAEMVMPAQTMAVLMNRYILPSADTAIKRVEVTFGDGVIQMRGTMRKAGVPVGFTATAVPSPSPDGEMLIRITRMKAAGFIPKGVMDALGLKMDKVAQPHDRDVFRIAGDTMIIPVSSMFPPPKFLGPLRAVRVTPQGMVAMLGTGRAAPLPLRANAFLAMRGGRVKFGRLTMADTNLTMVPKEGGRSLGFSPRDYWRQLDAGYTEAKPDYGLVGHIADYRRLGAR